MEIIKFRAKPTSEIPDDVIEDMGEDFKDGFVYGQINYDDGGEPWIFSKISESNEDFVLPHWWTPVIAETIGQYIGISDISENPQELYTGDLVEITIYSNAEPTKVICRQLRKIELKECIFGVQWTKTDFLSLKHHFAGNCEILKIGNTTDNPELMKGNESCQ